MRSFSHVLPLVFITILSTHSFALTQSHPHGKTHHHPSGQRVPLIVRDLLGGMLNGLMPFGGGGSNSGHHTSPESNTNPTSQIEAAPSTPTQQPYSDPPPPSQPSSTPSQQNPTNPPAQGNDPPATPAPADPTPSTTSYSTATEPTSSSLSSIGANPGASVNSGTNAPPDTSATPPTPAAAATASAQNADTLYDQNWPKATATASDTATASAAGAKGDVSSSSTFKSKGFLVAIILAIVIAISAATATCICIRWRKRRRSQYSGNYSEKTILTRADNYAELDSSGLAAEPAPIGACPDRSVHSRSTSRLNLAWRSHLTNITRSQNTASPPLPSPSGSDVMSPLSRPTHTDTQGAASDARSARRSLSVYRNSRVVDITNLRKSTQSSWYGTADSAAYGTEFLPRASLNILSVESDSLPSSENGIGTGGLPRRPLHRPYSDSTDGRYERASADPVLPPPRRLYVTPNSTPCSTESGCDDPFHSGG